MALYVGIHWVDGESAAPLRGLKDIQLIQQQLKFH
jgi:hypothetical protein